MARHMINDDPSIHSYLFISKYEGTVWVQPFDPEMREPINGIFRIAVVPILTVGW
ncbi:MAG: hypothetical protein K9M94_07840 [Spirochaetia bacterium]|nr:hypothetical protein [Spirochaetia bacterium]